MRTGVRRSMALVPLGKETGRHIKYTLFFPRI